MDSCRLDPVLRHLHLAAPRELIAMLDAVQPGTIEYGAAQLLFALRGEMQSIDRLAARLGLTRNFVAQCMRRLVDSGVIEDGRMVCSWGADPIDPRCFLADLEVALGRWVRWKDVDGTLRWAPAGAWVKKYDYQEGPEDDRNRTHFLNVALPEQAAAEAMRARLPVAEPRWLGAPAAAGVGVLTMGLNPETRREPSGEWERVPAGSAMLCESSADVVWLS